MRTAVLALVGTAVALALLELASIPLVRRLEADAPPGSLRGIDPERTRFEELYLSAKILHPYLGYAADPSDPRVNAHGWFGPDPLEPAAADEVVIAIFGGSVAMSFQETEAQFARALAAAGAFPGRRPRLVHAALDGYKQPQQLLLLAYLLGLGARFDVVVNLDGFNDVALPPAENLPAGVNPFYPRNWHLFSKKGFAPELARAAARVQVLAERRERWRRRLLEPPVSASRSARAAGLWLDRRLYADWRDAITQLEDRLAGERNAVHDLGPSRPYGSDEEIFRDLARVWARSSQQMAALCAANGIAYHHFLQPNQYAPGSKTWSAQERRSAVGGPEFAFRRAVEAGYPLLRAAGAELREAGVAFTDLTGLFRDETGTIYVDRCCHLNEGGYHRMNERIAAEIAAGADR